MGFGGNVLVSRDTYKRTVFYEISLEVSWVHFHAHRHGHSFKM